jgi:hypothetical protein
MNQEDVAPSHESAVLMFQNVGTPPFFFDDKNNRFTS